VPNDTQVGIAGHSRRVHRRGNLARGECGGLLTFEGVALSCAAPKRASSRAAAPSWGSSRRRTRRRRTTAGTWAEPPAGAGVYS
jgi:hypothetical protein